MFSHDIFAARARGIQPYLWREQSDMGLRHIQGHYADGYFLSIYIARDPFDKTFTMHIYIVVYCLKCFYRRGLNWSDEIFFDVGEAIRCTTVYYDRF